MKTIIILSIAVHSSSFSSSLLVGTGRGLLFTEMTEEVQVVVGLQEKVIIGKLKSRINTEFMSIS